MNREIIMKNMKQVYVSLFVLALAAGVGYAEKPSTRPVVTFVELGSVNCMPCKMMQPVMADIEKEYAGSVSVVFHDVWTKEGAVYGKQYKVSAIPTQVFLDKDGREFFRHQGFFPKQEIVKIFDKKGVKKTVQPSKSSPKSSATENYTVTGTVCK